MCSQCPLVHKRHALPTRSGGGQHTLLPRPAGVQDAGDGGEDARLPQLHPHWLRPLPWRQACETLPTRGPGKYTHLILIEVSHERNRGMAISHQIRAQQEGTLTVQSTVGQGSCVTLTQRMLSTLAVA